MGTPTKRKFAIRLLALALCTKSLSILELTLTFEWPRG